MKKILTLIVAVAAIVVAVSCNKDENNQNHQTVTVEISILNGVSATKAVTSPASANRLVCQASELTALFADATGAVVKSASFDGMTTTDGKYTFTGIPASVAKVAVIALRGYDMPTDLAGARSLWNTTEMVVAEANKTIVYGEDLAPTTTKGDNGYVLSAAMTVNSNHARIEVSSISCTDMGTYSAIALNKMTLAGYDYYAETLTTTLQSVSDEATAGEDKVWSWNVKEQNVANIVLDMEVTGNGYTEAYPARTLTVNSYKVNGTAISKFEAGNVYNFAINFAASNLASDADATVSADVTVTISEWVINTTEVGFAN